MKPFATEHVTTIDAQSRSGTRQNSGRKRDLRSLRSQRLPRRVVRSRSPLPSAGAGACRAVDDGRPVRVTTDRRGFAGGAVLRAPAPGGRRATGGRTGGRAEAGEAGLGRRGGIATSGMSRSSDGAVYRIFRDRDHRPLVHRRDSRLTRRLCPCRRVCTSNSTAASAFSFLQGASLPEALVDRAAALGYPALALLDRDGVYGAPRFHKAARRPAGDHRPIIGAELTIGRRLERLSRQSTRLQPSRLPCPCSANRRGLSQSVPADHAR